MLHFVRFSESIECHTHLRTLVLKCMKMCDLRNQLSSILLSCSFGSIIFCHRPNFQTLQVLYFLVIKKCTGLHFWYALYRWFSESRLMARYPLTLPSLDRLQNIPKVLVVAGSPVLSRFTESGIQDSPRSW